MFIFFIISQSKAEKKHKMKFLQKFTFQFFPNICLKFGAVPKDKFVIKVLP